MVGHSRLASAGGQKLKYVLKFEKQINTGILQSADLLLPYTDHWSADMNNLLGRNRFGHMCTQPYEIMSSFNQGSSINGLSNYTIQTFPVVSNAIVHFLLICDQIQCDHYPCRIAQLKHAVL